MEYRQTDQELEDLLEKTKGVKMSPEELEESHVRMAVANGVISDGRVTEDALKAAQVVKAASKAVAREASKAQA